MKKSGISERSFTSLLIGMSAIIAVYLSFFTNRPVRAAPWAFVAVFHIFIFLKREIYDDW